MAMIGGMLFMMVLTPAAQADPGSGPCSLTATSPQGKVVHHNTHLSHVEDTVARLTAHGYTDIVVDCR